MTPDNCKKEISKYCSVSKDIWGLCGYEQDYLNVFTDVDQWVICKKKKRGSKTIRIFENKKFKRCLAIKMITDSTDTRIISINIRSE